MFLDLSDSDIVNLHGVTQTYTICEPDPNLPDLPKPIYSSGGGALVRKMMDSTFAAMTLKKKKKNSLPKNSVVSKTGSLMDLSDDNSLSGSMMNLSKILEPLKDKPNKPDKTETPPVCRVMLRPATIERTSDDTRGMSLYDFLSTLGPNEDTDTTLGLPAKSPLFSSYHELREASESDTLDQKRTSVMSDGHNTVSQRVKHRRRGSLFSFLDSMNQHGSQVTRAESHSSVISSISSTISSVSGDKPSQFQSWSEVEADSYKSEQYDSTSDISMHSYSGSQRGLEYSSMSTKLSDSPVHNSILHHSAPQSSLSPTEEEDGSRRVDVPGTQSAASSIHDGSYSCEVVPVTTSDLKTISPSNQRDAVTFVVTDSSNSSTTIKAMSPLSEPNRLTLSPLMHSRKVPVSSTPKKCDVRMSRSMGNMSDMLHFLEDEDNNGGSLEEFMERELSCLDSSDLRNGFFPSQDELSSSASQREALECSTNSSSLDFSFTQPSPSSSLVRANGDVGGQQHRFSPRIRKTVHGNFVENQKLSPVQKHKWSSMDNLRTPKHETSASVKKS